MAESKLNVVLIGDAGTGKSTLCEKILVETGQKIDHPAKKIPPSMDWSFRDFKINTKRVTLFDIPGVKNRLREKMEGASLAEIGVLVVSATALDFDGNIENHINLANGLALPICAVLINKMDYVNWSKDRYDDIKLELTPYIEKHVKGFPLLSVSLARPVSLASETVFISISSLDGMNIANRMGKEICPWWWDGPCLFEVLNSIENISRDPKAPLRMMVVNPWVPINFPMPGDPMDILFGDYVVDTSVVVDAPVTRDLLVNVESGTVNVGDSLYIKPTEVNVKVHRILMSEYETEVERAGPCELVNIQFFGLGDIEKVVPGSVLCSEVDKAIVTCCCFYADLDIMWVPPMEIFSSGFSANLFMHFALEHCEVVEVTNFLNPVEEDPAVGVVAGGRAECHIKVNRQICISDTKEDVALRRIILVKYGRIVGSGLLTRADKCHTCKCKPHKLKLLTD